jgi:hypothetical protein
VTRSCPLGAPVYFATSGLQTLRVQQREDGVIVDQIVPSAGEFFSQRPGTTKNDTSIVPASFGASDGVTAAHTYKTAAVYPLVLRVTDTAGVLGWAVTTVTVGGPPASAPLAADAGGPYEGKTRQPESLNGGGSTVPSSVNAVYRWTFGDDIVLQAPMFTTAGARWRKIADSTAAAGGSALPSPCTARSARVTTPAGR